MYTQCRPITYNPDYLDDTIHYPTFAEVERQPKFKGWYTHCDTFELIDTIEAFVQVIEELRKAQVVAFDSETEGLIKKTHRSIGFSFTYRKDFGPLAFKDANELRNVYIPMRHISGQPNIPPRLMIKALTPILKDDSKLWILWFEKFDFHMLENDGLPIPLNHIDGQILHRILFPGQKSALKPVASKYFQHTNHLPDLIAEYIQALCRKNNWPMSEKRGPMMPSYFEFIPTPIMTAYSGRDTFYTWQVVARLLEKLQKNRRIQHVFREHIWVSELLYEIERFGLYLDLGQVQKITDMLQDKVKVLSDKILAYAPPGFVTLRNDGDVGALFAALQIPKKYVTKKTQRLPPGQQQYALNRLAMMQMESDGWDIAAYVKEWRECKWLLSTYLYRWPELIQDDGAIHSTFFTVGSETWRAQSARPNLQNIPKRTDLGKMIRSCFWIPPRFRGTHVWLFVDMSQIELRVFAHLSGDPLLVRSYNDDEDIHQMTAYRVFGERCTSPDAAVRKSLRDAAKELNFSILYGLGVLALQEKLFMAGIHYNIDQCKMMMSEFKKTYHMAIKWTERMVLEARQNGYIENELGYFRAMPELHDPKATEEELSKLSREIPNAIIQSFAALLFKLCLNKLRDNISDSGIDGVHWVNVIHDEFQVLVEPHKIPAFMEAVDKAFVGDWKDKIDVPLKYNVQWSPTHWNDKRDFDQETFQKDLANAWEDPVSSHEGTEQCEP